MYKLKRAIIFLLGRRKADSISRYLNKIKATKGNPSFGQEGEDRVLESLLSKVYSGQVPRQGFYVDVGAHHPYRFSNTTIFYRRGWHGINIDATPSSMTTFMHARSRDINLAVGVGLQHGKATLYIFNEDALNTFDQELALAREIPPWKIESTVEVPIYTLAEILEKHLPSGQPIDFLTIDVEGFDMAVLQSSDWTKFRPRVVLVETFGNSIEEAVASPVSVFLKSVGYTFYSKTISTSFFVDSQYISG
ncbi:MAG: FkbM family methyltransferase [Deltaproteobacteria bacterium]|nr:FkbM family methyltransferase [Deltaproteobacteria bacterium]